MQNRQQLDQHIHEMLQEQAKRLDVTLINQTIQGCFAELIRLAHEKHGERVVVAVASIAVALSPGVSFRIADQQQYVKID
jgi:hypothetical protein